MKWFRRIVYGLLGISIVFFLISSLKYIIGLLILAGIGEAIIYLFRPKSGELNDMLRVVSKDNDPLKDFKEYM